MTHATKINILKYGSIFLIGFGLLNFLTLFPLADPVMQLFMNLAFLTGVGTEHLVSADAARLWIAISGGLLAGWGVTLLLITTQVYAPNPALGRRIILSGILTWFVVDSAGSIAAGAPFNAVLNLSFLALFALPVAWPERNTTLSAHSA